MKSIIDNALLLLLITVGVAVKKVAATSRSYINPCNRVCYVYITESFTTLSNCRNNDYACMCADEVFPKSYAMCVDQCPQEDQAYAWRSLETSCEAAGVSLQGGHKKYLELAHSNYVDQTNVTKKSVASVAVSPTSSLIGQNYLARAEKNHNMQWSEYYGNVLNAYWGFVMLLAFGRLITLKLYSRKGSRQVTIVSKFRKCITLPATWGRKHIEPQKLGSFQVNVIPTRWQSIVIFIFTALNITLLFVDMWTVPNNTIYYTDALMRARNIGDRAALLGMALFPLLFLFGGRNNVLMFFTGWSFETFNVFHRWIGRMMFINFAMHGWFFTYYYRHIGEYKGESNFNYWKGHILDDKDNWLGIVAITLIGVILIQASYVLRHHWYEIFLVLHIAAVVSYFATAWNHVQSHGYMEYFYTSVAIWGFDRLIRIGRILLAGPLSKANVTVHGDAVYVAVKPAVHFQPKPGQYAFLYVLRHNFWESHPFSIMESRDNHYIFVAKAHKGLTRKIHKSVAKKNGNDLVSVWIEGPYGDSYPIARYETVLLIAGGIGITAVISYALDLKRRNTQQHVILYWMVREQSSLSWVQDQLQELTEGGLIEINIYITGETEGIKEKIQSASENTSISDFSEKNQAVVSPVQMNYNQRPEIRSVVGDTVQNAEGSVAVVSCGPGSLADECRKAVADNVDKGKWRVDYFEDAFSWA
ncbi:ferric reductase NAD binding domain-containing protein [Lipomyces kononenkoae]|uniref:Ferric reductase NAD binding domain-containing protein n=1 Tax=Lipomyces kononenkoae TaxID=34357 RepID=A0ACC3SZB4_LIPKO